MSGHNKIIPRDETTDLELWDFPYVGEGEPPASSGAGEASAAPPLTAEAVEQIQQQAYQEAFEQGYREGLEKGLAEGREQGRAEGLEQGRQEGLEQGRQQAKQLAEQWQALLQTLARPLAELDHQVEQELISLAMQVARHVVRREIKTDPAQVIGAVRKAVSVLPLSARDVRVFLHPEDASLVRQSLSVGDDSGDEERRWKIVEDPALTRGGCIIETEQSRIDATVESRLAAVIAQVMGGERESDAG